MPVELRCSLKRISILAAVILFQFATSSLAQSPNAFLPGPKPADIPVEWKGLIGSYGSKDKPFLIVEEDEGLKVILPVIDKMPLVKVGKDLFRGGSPDLPLWFKFNLDGRGIATRLSHSGEVLSRIKEGPEEGHPFQIIAQHPIEQLRQQALAASPPTETGSFHKPELVELAPLDSSIHLDIRYATSNDFFGTPVYSQARAFLQRPAADALVRLQKRLKQLGYGLLIHDAYRPWYVTKIFWDATPPEGKIFVADPAQGSRHNRGCAVDLTLYDLATGKAIEMPGTYDEMSPRSFPDYPGGTSLQRWHRDLLRRAMESEGFTVYEAEWWHFDFKDWREYPILNVPFEKLGPGEVSAPVH